MEEFIKQLEDYKSQCEKNREPYTFDGFSAFLGVDKPEYYPVSETTVITNNEEAAEAHQKLVDEGAVQISTPEDDVDLGTDELDENGSTSVGANAPKDDEPTDDK